LIHIRSSVPNIYSFMQVDSMKTARTIAIVYIDAASASRSAAVALQKALQARQPHCQVRLVNITDIFDHHRLFGTIVRRGINYFNRQLQCDRVQDLRGLIDISLLCHNLVGQKGIRKLAGYWKAFSPDIVISMTPLFNPVLYRSAQLANAAVQCITIPLDFVEVCSRYWFTPAMKQYYFNATDQLQQQAAKAGIPENYRIRINGMPVDERAYDARPRDRAAQLRTIGLNPDWPVGFLSFGAQGSQQMLAITHALAKQHRQLNLIILCGKNKKLFRQITALKLPFPTAVYSYLPNTPLQLLQLADFAIGQPGAMTITESLITHTPLIVQKSKGMRPLQKSHEAWLSKTGTGIVAATPAQIAAAVKEVITDLSYKEQLAAHQHQALFEIVALIEQIGQLERRIDRAA
jgi:UDP-N-acetylglucosamine:LPS N-acetylglucosamine transferase